MAGNDNLLAAITGALSGFQQTIQPFMQLKYQDTLARNRKQQDLNDQLAMYKQQAPIATDEAVRKSGLELAQAQPFKLAQIQAEKPSDSVYGSEINAARPDLGLNPTQKFNKAVLPLFKTPAETTAEKQAAKNKAKLITEKPKAEGAYNNAMQGYDSLITQANDILKDPSLSTATGATSFMGSVPGTGAKRVAANLETIKAKTLLNVLGGLKQLSSTGASGFGQLSNVEGETIKNSIANLDRSLGTADFKQNLRTFINEAVKSQANIKDTYDKTYGQLDSGGSFPTSKVSTTKERSADDILNQYLPQ